MVERLRVFPDGESARLAATEAAEA
jgi:hypothetical protein